MGLSRGTGWLDQFDLFLIGIDATWTKKLIDDKVKGSEKTD